MADEEELVFKIISSVHSTDDNFTCEIRSNMNENLFCKWLKSFSEATKTNWILRTSNTKDRSRFLLSRDYVCHHSSFHKKTSKKDVVLQKNKNCQASIKIKIKRNSKDTRYRDPYIKEGLCAVLSIKFQHTHLLNVAEAWGWLKRKDETRQAFVEYFNNGLSPADAIHFHEDLLLADRAENLADASINPPKSWVYYLHNIWRQNEYGGAIKDKSFYNVADKRLKDLEKEGYITIISNDPFKIIFVSPIMKRTLQDAKTPVNIFIDSSSSMDQTNTIVTVVSVETKAGSIPVCICLHHNKIETTYKSIFTSMFQIFDGINSNLKISMIMTDDDKALRNALSETFSNVRLLLCQFHVLQAVWRWLWSSANGVKKEDRKSIINYFKKTVYCTSETDLEISKYNLIKYLAHSHYFNAVDYFQKWFEKQNDWSFCGRKNILTRNNNTNNYAEATFRILKDIILTRLKAYNSLALLDFLTIVLEKYYKIRLLDFAYGRNKKGFLTFLKISNKSSTISKENIKKIEDGLFEVFCTVNNVYEVNQEVGCCSCLSGCQGGFCKHQAAVAIHYGSEFPNCPFLSPDDKLRLNKIALGESAVSAEFFKPMIVEVQNTTIGIENLTCKNSVNNNQIDNVNCSNENETSTVSNLNLNLNEEFYPNSTSPLSNSPILSNSLVIENFESQINKIFEIIKSNPDNESLMTAVNNINNKFKHIDGPESLISVLHGMSLGCRMKFGKKINVQPTAISRCKSGAQRGSKRIAAGRPLNQQPPLKKRKRSLATNIKDNVPNAKSHGQGH